MSTLTDLFPTHELLSYINNLELKQFALSELFPDVKVFSDDIRTIANSNQLPTIAHIHAYNTEAEIGDRTAEVTTQEPYYVKRKKILDEKTLRELAQPRNPQEKEYLMKVVFADVVELVNSINATTELMRVKTLTEGKFNLKGSDGKDYKFDYKLPKTAQTGNTSKFNDTAVDPIGLIASWASSADFVATRGLTSQTALAAILSNPHTVERVLGPNATVKSVMPGDFAAYMASQGLPQLVAYRDKYIEDGKTQNFVSDSKLALFGDGTVGNTVYGITPEESRMVTSGSIQASQVGNVMINSFESDYDPIQSTVKASAVVIPTLAQRNSLLLADVL